MPIGPREVAPRSSNPPPPRPSWAPEPGRAPSGKLVATIEPRASLGAELRSELWTLFVRYHANAAHDVFSKDLADKDHVILLRDSGDRTLRGFSTLKTWDQGGVTVLFSGDTVVEPSYAGQNALRLAFARYALRTKLARPMRPLYWLLCAKSVQTYLLLTRFFPEHWPRVGRELPADVRALREEIAGRRYAKTYDAARGVLRAEGWCGAVRADEHPAPLGGCDRPEVELFGTLNPGANNGDALVCLGRLDASFFVGAPLRLVAHAWSRARRPAARDAAIARA